MEKEIAIPLSSGRSLTFPRFLYDRMIASTENATGTLLSDGPRSLLSNSNAHPRTDSMTCIISNVHAVESLMLAVFSPKVASSPNCTGCVCMSLLKSFLPSDECFPLFVRVPSP